MWGVSNSEGAFQRPPHDVTIPLPHPRGIAMPPSSCILVSYWEGGQRSWKRTSLRSGFDAVLIWGIVWFVVSLVWYSQLQYEMFHLKFASLLCPNLYICISGRFYNVVTFIIWILRKFNKFIMLRIILNYKENEF